MSVAIWHTGGGEYTDTREKRGEKLYYIYTYILVSGGEV